MKQSLTAQAVVIAIVLTCAAAAIAAFASAREHRRLMQKGVVVDLLDEEIRYVGARDEAPCPAARIDQRAIGVRLRPICQDHGTHNHPVELAPTNHGAWIDRYPVLAEFHIKYGLASTGGFGNG